MVSFLVLIIPTQSYASPNLDDKLQISILAAEELIEEEIAQDGQEDEEWHVCKFSHLTNLKTKKLQVFSPQISLIECYLEMIAPPY